MVSAQMHLFIFLLFYGRILHCHAAKIAEDTADGVKLVSTGSVDLIYRDKFTFKVRSTCKGRFTLCYSTEALTTIDGYAFDNVAKDCPSDRCHVTFTPDLATYTKLLTVAKLNDETTATFDISNLPVDFCPFKKTKNRQSFQILELPNCPVFVVKAKLAPSEMEEDGEQDEDESEKEASSDQPTAKTDTRWVIAIIAGVIASLVGLGVIAVIAYKVRKAYCARKAAHQAQQAPKPQIGASKSPAPTSPMTRQPKTPPAPSTPPVPASPAPSTPPAPSIMPPTSTMPATSMASRPITPPFSPSICSPPSDGLSRAQRIHKFKKTQKMATATSGSTKTSTAKSISPPFEMAVKRVEDAPRNLNRNKMLVIVGMVVCGIGSQLDAFLQKIYEIFEPFPKRRNIAEWELSFFLSIVSDAFHDAPALLKKARQELCRHGAVYDHRRFVSFNERTDKYIKKVTTPGFIAWYAFATRYGGGIKIEDDENMDATLNRLSVPALFAVFCREELDVEVRRSAYRRIRYHMTQIVCMYPNRELLGLPYPICLIPALLDKNRRYFHEGANDRSYSTPYEQLRQLRKYEATDEADITDETQVTYSDGKQREIIGSVEVLGTNLDPSTTVEEDWRQ